MIKTLSQPSSTCKPSSTDGHQKSSSAIRSTLVLMPRTEQTANGNSPQQQSQSLKPAPRYLIARDADLYFLRSDLLPVADDGDLWTQHPEEAQRFLTSEAVQTCARHLLVFHHTKVTIFMEER